MINSRKREINLSEKETYIKTLGAGPVGFGRGGKTIFIFMPLINEGNV